DGHVRERDPERAHVRLEVGVVRDHLHDLRAQLAAAPAPEEVEQAVLVARDEHRSALRTPVLEAPLHPEPARDLVVERALELGRVGPLGGEVELGPHEEGAALRVRRVLGGVDDVRAALEEEARDARDDARAIRAGDQEPDARHAAAQAVTAGRSFFTPPEVSATISAAIASATCAGARPPRSSPAGPWMRSISASEKPCSARRARRRSAVRFAPTAPT